MAGTRKQSAKSLDHKCDVCGTVVLGNISKLKYHIVRFHSAMKNPKICKHCGNSSNHGGAKFGSKGINHGGLKKSPTIFAI